MERIRAIVTSGASVTASVTGSAGLSAAVSKAVGMPYQGAYTITPSNQAQTLPTAGASLAQDITVEPIPSNYGLITWNGSVITVS